MSKTDCVFMGVFIWILGMGITIMPIVFNSVSPIQHTYDGRPYIKHGGRYYMLISDEPMKIKSVNVVEPVESEGK